MTIQFTISRVAFFQKQTRMAPEAKLMKVEEQAPRGTATKPCSRGMADSLSRRLWLLDSQKLCARARQRTGLEDFGDPPLEPTLSKLVNSLEAEADLHPLGRF